MIYNSNINITAFEEINTESDMDNLLTAQNVGKLYQYIGSTGTYTNGDFYLVCERVDS